jgi:hypothetical protein
MGQSKFKHKHKRKLKWSEDANHYRNGGVALALEVDILTIGP